LFGAQAWLCSLSSKNPNDVQPSFAENSIRIACPESNISWIVANPTVEDQRTFLDRLCFAGCILYDIGDHFTLLPPDAQPSRGVRLGYIHATARRTTNAEIVALKVASNNDRMSQLINEVQFLLNLHHDGIVGAYGIYAVKAEDRRSLAMLLEHKKGGDLSSWIPTGGLPEPMVRGIAAQICDALVYLHAIPAVHRDIKPSNVLCERAEDGSVKVFLADFGLAAYARDRKSMSRRCGTGGYIAPEMFRNDWPVKSSSQTVINITKIDVFSFGMLLYETALGTNPFKADDASWDTKLRGTSRASLSVANMAGQSDELQHLLFGLCAKNPCKRFSSSEALAHPWFSSDNGVSYSNDAREYAKVGWTALQEAPRRFRARRFRRRSEEDRPLTN
jgi:serine/threonine protein kinase